MIDTRKKYQWFIIGDFNGFFGLMFDNLTVLSFLAGILTKWDVLRATASGEDPSGSLVSEWMTRDPQSVNPDTPVEDATRVMMLHGFHHLPVVEGKELLGVIRLRDLLAAKIRRPAVPAAAPAGATDEVPARGVG